MAVCEVDVRSECDIALDLLGCVCVCVEGTAGMHTSCPIQVVVAWLLLMQLCANLSVGNYYLARLC